ncbi:MAG: GNAT family N-acetyltransferase [Sideroxydans sp.]
MDSRQRFIIEFSPDSAKAVSRYVTRGFFGPRELPQAFARMLLTGEFGFFVGIPILFLLASKFLPMMIFGQWTETISQILTVLAVIWLVAGLIRISRYGTSGGIGCYTLGEDGSQGELVGGLRMRFERRARRIWIAGLLVEPDWRGAGIGTALVLAAFRIAQERAEQGPVILSVFAPSHPASKAIIEKQLDGQQTMSVTALPSESLRRTIERLESALRKSPSLFEWQLSNIEGRQ